jgi:integrase
MKRKAPQSDNLKGDKTDNTDKKGKNQGHGKLMRFTPVKDSRNRKVRGLVTRNGRFYAQMRIALPDGKSRALRIPLEASRLDHAIAEAEAERTKKRQGEIHLPGVRPNFAKLVEQYLQSNVGTRRTRGKGYLSKSESTQNNEKQSLERLISHLGAKRIDWIEERDLVSFVNKRTREGVKNRTINLDLIAFNNCMGYALKQKLIVRAPRLEKQIEEEIDAKRLLTREEIDRFIEAAQTPATFNNDKEKEMTYHAKNGRQLSLFIKFLASSGCREQEALKIQKEDVDLKGELISIRATNTKSGKKRVIHLNSALAVVLKEILASLPPETQWLFPSPRRGVVDRPADSLRQSFVMVRKIVGLPEVGFHHFRHYFASRCVMQGMDFMTIAEWLGHQDGGILVGKTYGHLNDEHKRSAAKKLTF